MIEGSTRQDSVSVLITVGEYREQKWVDFVLSLRRKLHLYCLPDKASNRDVSVTVPDTVGELSLIHI